MRKLIATIFAAVFALVTTAPAFADAAVPLRGTFADEDFSEVFVPSLPTSGEPGLLVTIQIDTNLGPVTQTVEVPFSTVVVRGNAGVVNFQGLGRWDFGNGDVLHTQAALVFSPETTIVAVREDVIGGEGLYAGAAGKIHTTQFGPEQPAFPPLGGFIAGVIRLPGNPRSSTPTG